MGIGRFFDNLGNGLIGFFFKIMFYMLALVFIMALVMVLFIYWPFTVALIIGLLCSEQMYRRLSRRFNIRLPKYFYININDFIATFSIGDEEVDALALELKQKRAKANKQLEEIKAALQSADEQLQQIKTKRSLKTLFKKPVSEVSPRTAKALEMELGKPLWVSYIDKASRNTNGDWDKLMA